MDIKSIWSKFIKGFGFIYFLVNCMMLAVILIMAVYTMIKTPQFTPGWIFLIFPTAGMFSGYWMRIGKYGWWRILIIAVSLLLTAAVAFTAIFVAPKMEEMKKAKFESMKGIETLDPEVKKMFMALYVADEKVVREQLDKGVNVNAMNDAGSTPLHITQSKAIVKLLIEKGADVNALDESGKTPIFSKEVELTKILVEAGANINVRSNKYDSTPLTWYAYSGYLEGIQYMVSLGADINAKNSDGRSAYDIAKEFGHFELLDYLKSVGAKPGEAIE